MTWTFKAWCWRRMTAAGAAILMATAISAVHTPGGAQYSSMQRDTVVSQIQNVQEQGGSDAWDRAVIKILRAAYDRDGSGWIDTEQEVNAIPCDVLLAMDKLIQSYNKGRSGLAWTYGFQPDTRGKRYSYLGNALGFSRNMRQTAFARIAGCGVRTR